MTTIKSFVERLAKIGVKVELVGNYPWVYLDKVSGNKVWGKLRADHGFTVFFSPIRLGEKEKITDVKAIFSKIREMLCERVKEYEVILPGYFDGEEGIMEQNRLLFYGTEDQCKRWVIDYDEEEEFIIRKC